MKLSAVLCAALLSLAAVPALAQVRVFACEPEWAALVEDLGGEAVAVFSATTAHQDPHRIQARPSLIAQLRRADLLVCTGAGLEAGWLPLLLRRAGNARVQPGRPGYLEAAMLVERLDVPESLDRALGDLHAAGNPHVHMDPRRLATIAQHVAERLAEVDADNAAHYRRRHQAFARRWQEAIARWEARAAPLRGMRVVAHHRDWVYLYDWLALEHVGTLEPKPGIPPGAAHLSALKRELARHPARAVLRTPYQDPRPSEWLARETGIEAIVLPYTVGGTPAARDLYTLFDDTLARLLEAAS